MRSRKDLSPILHSIMSNYYGESKYKVYWQQPTGTKMSYPCLIYEMNTINHLFGDNLGYRNLKRYNLTLIGKEPDNDVLLEAFLKLPYCSFDRRFISDNLYHDVLELYY